MKTYPYQLPFGVQLFGRSMPVWVYDSVPEGMRRAASAAEIRNGQCFLYRSQLSPGEYLTGWMRPQIRAQVAAMIAASIPVFVK